MGRSMAALGQSFRISVERMAHRRHPFLKAKTPNGLICPYLPLIQLTLIRPTFLLGNVSSTGRLILYFLRHLPLLVEIYQEATT